VVHIAAVVPVEVLRAAERSVWDHATTICLGIAAAGVVAIGVLALRGRGPQRILASLVAVVTGAELLFLAVGAGGLDVVTDRRGLAALARLGLIAAILAIEATTRQVPERPQQRDPSVIALSFLALATVPLAMPGAGGSAGLLAAVWVTLGLTAGVAVLTLLAARWSRSGITLVIVLVVGAVTGALAMSEPSVEILSERFVVEDVALDLTVAPVQPGRNEIHIYAWDAAGDPVALERVDARVIGPRADDPVELFVVTPNHHLSYLFTLPGDGPWEIELSAQRPDGELLTLRTSLEAS
jgi:hypothetical protein